MSEELKEYVEGGQNTVTVTGEVLGETRLIQTKNKVPLCQFRIKNTLVFLNRREVSEFDVEAWGRMAEYCAHQLRDGDKITVKGRVKQDRWTDHLGRFTSKIKLVVDHVELVQRKVD